MKRYVSHINGIEMPQMCECVYVWYQLKLHNT